MSAWDFISNTNNTVSIVSSLIAIGSACWGAFSGKRAAKAATKANELLDKLNDHKKRTELENIRQVITSTITEIRKIGYQRQRDEIQVRGTNYQGKYVELAKQIRHICSNTSTIHGEITEKLSHIERELNSFSRQEGPLPLEEEDNIITSLDNILSITKRKIDEIEGRLVA